MVPSRSTHPFFPHLLVGLAVLLLPADFAVMASQAAATSDHFLGHLNALCGRAFAGKVVADEPAAAAGSAFAGKALVIHLRDCGAGEVAIPLHVGDDRSRTWVIRRTATGLHLSHQHRHADGSFDRVTGYGGDSVDRSPAGSASAAGDLRFEFPADEATRALFERENLAVSRDNVWALSVGRQADPARRLVYELRRPGRHFRIEFDLTRPVPLPPAAWGSDDAASAVRRPAPLLSTAEVEALAQEVSGESAMRTVEGLSRHHRMRGSTGFRAAAEQIVTELHRFGLTDAHLIELPADGTIFYGTQRSRPAWNARFAELWEIDANGARRERLASWDEAPIGLAQDSHSAVVPSAELIDVGAGTSPADYLGREVEGRLVLTSSQPGAVAELAIGKHGARGIVSWAQNQKQAWWGDDETLVRWGHLATFSAHPTFAFMISPERAQTLQSRLAAGETIRLAARVDAGTEPGVYAIASATIPGSDPSSGEIVWSCHLDHPRPGANDNASGCATILEVARTLSKLIAEGRLPQPRRTLRFVWPPEIEGTLALLAGRPELEARISAALHLDMVGGGPATGAVFHVTRGPASLPSIVHDIAGALATWINEQTLAFAQTGDADRLKLVADGGGKEPLRAELAELTLGSDHQVYGDSSFSIPAVYMNDWPDRTIHTDRDVPANLDATKLERVAFLAAATGWVLANLEAADAAEVWAIQRAAALRRAATVVERSAALPGDEAANLTRFFLQSEKSTFESISAWLAIPPSVRTAAQSTLADLARLVGSASSAPTASARRSGTVYRRNPAHPGTAGGFGYDWLEDRLGAEASSALRLPHYAAGRRSGEDYAYEALNLVDGRRSTLEIRDALAAIYGPVPLALVEEYLTALERAELIGH